MGVEVALSSRYKLWYTGSFVTYRRIGFTGFATLSFLSFLGLNLEHKLWCEPTSMTAPNKAKKVAEGPDTYKRVTEENNRNN